jgi:hypothetical protein
MKRKSLPKGYTPSAKDAEWFIKNWREQERFSIPVDVMLKLCQETHPLNNNIEEVLLKCAVIDNFSSTNVFDLYSMAKHIVKKQIDVRLKENDYSLIDDIATVGLNRKFYSFATKYCHYHNPEGFAIYDRYVAKVLCSFPDDFRLVKEEQLRNYKTFIEVLNEFRHHYKLNLSFNDLDKYLWRLGRWYLNPYEPTFKYYHREEFNPFPKDDTRGIFWEGEKKFFSTNQNVSHWKQEGKEWLKTANEQIKQLASKYSPEQFGVIKYISMLYSRHCPYDGQEWILDY